MSDGTGMYQHAIGIIPDRRHGYCLDDNVRALMLVNQAQGLDPHERQSLAMTYAAFMQHAWNPDKQGFRNFMRFDRSWCEDLGSEDSNGRAIWTLGRTAQDSTDPDIRDWAIQLYDQTLPAIAKSESPRTTAFVMLGAAAMLRARPHAPSADALRKGAEFLERLLGGARRPDWAWFEAVLGYDNPRLPQALIEAGETLGRPEWTAIGLESLAWIAERQTAADGYFRPIGSESFGREYAQLPFDQQPLEAWAAIDAALSAYPRHRREALAGPWHRRLALVLRRQRSRRRARRHGQRALPRRAHPARREQELRSGIDPGIPARALFHG